MSESAAEKLDTTVMQSQDVTSIDKQIEFEEDQEVTIQYDKLCRHRAFSVELGDVCRDDKRRIKPSQKMQEKLEQEEHIVQTFWSTVKATENLMRETEVNWQTSDQHSHAQALRRLNWQLEDVDDAYANLRKALPGTVPTEARRALDRCRADIQSLLQPTELEGPIPRGNVHYAHSHCSDASRESATSSRKAALAARARTLQIEIEAKKEEEKHRIELKKLEADLERKKQEIERQRIQTELKKTTAELQTLQEEENGHTSYNVQATPFLPRTENQNRDTFTIASPPIQMSTPGRCDDTNISTLMKTFSDSLNLSRLPIPEPITFHGDPLQYPAWKASFSALIESRQIPAAEKIHYLKRYLEGEAKEAVDSLFYLNTSEAYVTAQDILEERYGNSFLVAETFRNKLEAWPKIGGYDNKGLRKLADFLRQCCTAMNHVTELKILDDCRENRKILQKLPEWLVRRWSRIIAERKSYPKFEEFVKFLTKEADIVNNPVTSFKPSGNRSDEQSKPRKRSAGANTFLNDNSVSTNGDLRLVTDKEQVGREKDRDNSSRPTCVFCEKTGHNTLACYLFAKETAENRDVFIMKKGLCRGCLKGGHIYRDCKNRSTCEKCQGRHPTCMHGDYETLQSAKQNRGPANKNPEKGDQREPATVLRATQIDSETSKCSMTVPVYISSDAEPDREVMVYALLDTQSDTTFISDETVEKLNVNAQLTKLKISTMTSSTTVNCLRVSGLSIRGANSTERISLPTTYTRNYIPMNRSHIPTPEVVSGWPHLHGVKGKIMPLQDCEIGLLIGYNCPQALAPINVVTGEADNPFAVETRLGWSIVGMVHTSHEEEEHVSHKIKTKEEILLPRVVRILESDFTGNQAGENTETLSQEDLKFTQIIEEGIHMNGDGFYEMPLPFKDGKPNLPNNLSVAEKRLDHLKRRLLRDPKYCEDYKKFMNDMINREDAEEAPTAENGTVWYIPHHGVYHPKKPGKIRVVFDCSSRYKDTALNDHLLGGPDLINSLVGVLCRFRERPIAIMGDVESMFHRFKVDPADRSYLQFLWWKDGDLNSEPITYRMTVHLFGATSSPGCAMSGLKKLASDSEGDCSSEVIDYLRNDFYVDDGLRSCDTEEEASQLIQDARDICMKGNIRLHKFISNSKKVMQTIPESERAKELTSRDINFDSLPLERALGVYWCVEADCFQFRVTISGVPMTRRQILSTVASVFDPLGCLAPFVLIGKQVLQQMCKENATWDDLLADELRPKWERWITDLPKLATIQVPRCLVPENFGTISRREFHHFSDASFGGYGQCSYIRVVNEKNQVHCALAMAKSRVTPLKVVTIPRLELAAAVVSTKISKILETEMRSQYEHHFWTDSQIVLGYINNDARRFKVYVANRIQMIRDSTNVHQWHHVASENNPADHASRGLNVDELQNTNWFTGPDFLWEPEVDDGNGSNFDLSEGDPEVKQTTVKLTSAENKPITERLEKFSDWSRAVKAISLLVKFVSCRKEKQTTNMQLTPEDMIRGENTIIRWIQQRAFKGEIEALNKQSSTEIDKDSPVYKLNPFLDKEGILRVGGRVDRSALAFGVKHPIILPNPRSDSHVVWLIIKYFHEKTRHQGRGFTINEIRSNGYWIIGCSKAVSSHIFKCVTCRKLRGASQNQKMADLPTDRLEPSPPFSHCGIDCFGPFLVKDGRRELKRYGLLITCMASRAIHIEMLDDMSTDCFMNAIRCFMALRGPVRTFRCDQGTNFIGAKNVLQRSLKEIVNEPFQRFMAENKCDFIFNAPKASHMGGTWERQIRTVRSVLSSILYQNSQRLDSTSLRTVFYEVMAIVNNRPLSPQNLNDPCGPEPLTPNHLITMKSKIILPAPGEFVKEDVYARMRWRKVQFLVDQFWTRWRKEYMLTLQSRNKWNKVRRNVSVGDIVVVRDEDLVRGIWTLGRVVDTIVDDDGLVRRVKIILGDPQLSATGKRLSAPSLLERPIQKLVVLLENQ